MFKRSIVAALSFSVLAGATAVPAQAAYATIFTTEDGYCRINQLSGYGEVFELAGVPYVTGDQPMEIAVKRQKQFAEVERQLTNKVNNPGRLSLEEREKILSYCR